MDELLDIVNEPTPDTPGPIVGYREWTGEGQLFSLTADYKWEPGWQQAKCARNIRQQGGGWEQTPLRLIKPGMCDDVLNCVCGFWCHNTSPANLLYRGQHLWGEVWLAGKVYEFTRGWRAEWAKVKAIYLPEPNIIEKAARVWVQRSTSYRELEYPWQAIWNKCIYIAVQYEAELVLAYLDDPITLTIPQAMQMRDHYDDQQKQMLSNQAKARELHRLLEWEKTLSKEYNDARKREGYGGKYTSRTDWGASAGRTTPSPSSYYGTSYRRTLTGYDPYNPF